MDLMVGQVMLTALDFAPTGTLACNGQLAPAATYGGLASVLGTSYGGNGTATFGVPNIASVPTTGSGAPLNWVIVAEGAPWPSGMEAAIGELRLFPLAPPANSVLAQSWLPCDGRTIPISENDALFALIGTLFGGDGVSTFAMPKLAPVAVPNGPALAYWICTQGFFPPIGGDSRTPGQGSYLYETYLATVMQVPYGGNLTQQLEGLGLCLAQTMPIGEWAAIFSLLGVRFGGNGTSNFLLPNKPTGTDNVACAMVLNGYYPPRS